MRCSARRGGSRTARINPSNMCSHRGAICISPHTWWFVHRPPQFVHRPRAVHEPPLQHRGFSQRDHIGQNGVCWAVREPPLQWVNFSAHPLRWHPPPTSPTALLLRPAQPQKCEGWMVCCATRATLHFVFFACFTKRETPYGRLPWASFTDAAYGWERCSRQTELMQ